MASSKQDGRKHFGAAIHTVDGGGTGIYELVKKQYRRGRTSEAYHHAMFDALELDDPELCRLIANEYKRRQNTIQLIAAENQCSQAVLAALGSIVQNKTTEGFVGARYHGGCEVVDDIESLAVERAKEAFGAEYANVQPHCGTGANQIVMTAVLEKDDKILSLAMDQGGHVSHGAKVSFSGKFFEVENYCVDEETLLLDYEAIRKQAVKFCPKLIICGASAYSRTIDFAMFREIADEVGAYLMADISHIAGLVTAGVHPSPIDHAHFTTTSTYKPGGPRGGLILMGRDYKEPIQSGGRQVSLWRLIERTTFPGVQGTPYLNNIAAKAVFFKEMLSDEYKQRQSAIIENAKRLAKDLVELGYDVPTGGTDNHMVLVNVVNFREGMTGIIAQKSLEDCGIIVNMNRLPYDRYGPRITSGVRLGTPIVTKNGMEEDEMDAIAEMIDAVLRGVEPAGEREYVIDSSVKNDVGAKVEKLCRQFPML